MQPTPNAEQRLARVGTAIPAELAVRIEMMRLGGANLPLGRSEDTA